MEMQAWVSGHNLPPGHPGHNVFAYPQSDTAPTVWMLGSSDYGAQLAAHLGLPYAFAYFITDGQGADEALQIYRETFRPSAGLAKPHAALCVWALAADTDEEALRLFESRARWKMDRNLGRIGVLLPPEEAARDYSPAEEFALQRLRDGALIGSAATVGRKLRQLAARLEVDELVVITWTHDPAAQCRSYELLAQEFALAANSTL
jgi:luciferase family oxidoreductase group 1